MAVRLLRDNEIRDRFRQMRESLGLSQGQLASALGVAQPSVAGWEGSGVPPIERRAQLADLAREPVTRLLVYEDGEPTETLAAVKLRVIGKVRDGNVLGAIEDLRAILPPHVSPEDAAALHDWVAQAIQAEEAAATRGA